MSQGGAIFAFSTSNYEAMIQFFRDIGMDVREERTQLCPIFESGRGALVTRGEVAFNIEESTADPRMNSFNLLFTGGFTNEDIQRLRDLGYNMPTETSLYGTFHTLKSPDGGTIVIAQ